MNGDWSSYDVVSSEGRCAMLPKGYRPDGTKPGVIFCHSHGNLADEILAYPWVDIALTEVAKAGYPILAQDFSNAVIYNGSKAPNWGRDDAITRVAAAKTYLQGTLGAKAGGVFGYAFSMGATTFLNWARQNLSSVLAFAAACPGVDVEWLRLQAPGEIEAAYTNLAGWNTARPTHDPMVYAAELAGVPMKLWYGSADTTVPPSQVTSFASAVGANASTVAMSGFGHDPRGVDGLALASFFQAHA